MDDEGENRAIRSFLSAYQNPSVTTVQMRDQMEMCGWDGCWPSWVSNARDGEGLTKSGAQIWIRHLLALESSPS